MTRIKEILTAGVGALGGLMSWLYGGFGDAMLVLIVFMALDYIDRPDLVAGVFHKSSKSETGALESKAGWKGLCRKGMTLGIVMMAALLDRIMGTAYIRDAVVVGFIFNEQPVHPGKRRPDGRFLSQGAEERARSAQSERRRKP